ncbi:UDP-N-acetylmuramate--L-alanine ligase [Arthrobacter roseus]|uniref:UDP-N-acetylmuramate--L-alanine ligase n=1 Tax=Arthrobacter roseus TaxID=136274 RepID=UPI001965124A|nr:UDP-N-acetylmuramate--L-alanine ligase [Arthrobacter roseus]MBM7848335.1 UDP-N-acetylmuramate--alanine ligase [Arthrobacter roseus]
MSSQTSTSELASLGRVHFIGLGGAGMSAVARIMIARGTDVSGSDSRDSALLRNLEQLGATVRVGQSADNVHNADTVVISTAIRVTNPELAEARRLDLRIIHRSEALAATMMGQRVIAVAGTHGKTTTTAMTTVMLQSAGADPSFAIGGDVSSLGVNAAYGDGGVFVAEADESDGSFLNYTPSISVVTNVEADHLDHYGTADAVHAVFDEFVTRLDSRGLLIVCADDDGSSALAARSIGSRRVQTYGYSDDADVRIADTSRLGSSSVSTLIFQLDGRQRTQELSLSVPGDHNIRNAVAAFTVALELGIDPSLAAEGLNGFSGAARRFEFRGESRGVRVYDEYAHHPTEVRAALNAARTVAGSGSVHVIFQPHLFSRTREFAAEFSSALALADSAAVLDIYPAREDPIPGVTSELITGTVGGRAVYHPDPRGALNSVEARARSGDVILTVGAGDVTALGAELVRILDRSVDSKDPSGL